MCKFGEKQPIHDYSAHHRSYGENGSQVKLSLKLVRNVVLEWPARIDSTMHLFGIQELLKTADISINAHFNFKRPDTCIAYMFSFTKQLPLRAQTFQ
jgi:hypothetical protein